MQIKTKFEPRQKVWVIKNNKPTELEICGVNIDCGKVGSLSGGIRVRYHFSEGFINGGTFEESEEAVFLTKEELIKSF